LAANERHDNCVHLIVDRGPAHRAKKTKAFVETLGGKLRLFFLPTYSPDRNPDELGWKHLKADKVGRMAVSGKEDFNRKVRLSMRQLHNDPNKNPLLLPNAISPIRRRYVNLLMD
jgi:transposase